MASKTYGGEGAVYQLLRTRYDERAWALFPHVSTGHSNGRYADAIAFSLWASRGHEIHGFEIKVSRSDWLNELNQPDKSAPIQKFCHRWWIVAGDRKLVKPDELPKTWGLMIPRGDGLEAKVQAPLLSPKKLTRKFCAAIMRRAQEGFAKNGKEIYADVFKKATEDAKRIAVRTAKFELEQENEANERELAEAKRKVSSLEYRIQHYERFEKIAGVTISNWPMQQVVQDIAAHRVGNAGERIKESLEELRQTAAFIDEALKRLEESTQGRS
jgi:hypothetical protein